MRVTLDIPADELTKLVTPALSEPRIPLHSVSWEQYEAMVTAVGSRPRLRMTYLEGLLEIMTISAEHEMLKKMIARLIEVYALEKELDLFSCGSATYRSAAAARGLEPDESYCIGTRKEFPDFAIEVVLTSGSLDKLKVYQGLGIPEVWFWQDGRLMVQSLQADGDAYAPVSRSVLLPDLDLNLLAEYIRPEDEPQAVRAFQNIIRGH
jgi:Uma2 family endonuclease